MTRHSISRANFIVNRLTFYPMLHINVFHYMMNMWGLIPLLRTFELANGTVRTGVVLNLTATIAGLAYVIIELALGFDTPVIGSSIWVFALLAYFSYLEHQMRPVWQIHSSFQIPTYAIPVAPLLISMVFVPGTSFLGHLLGMGAGYALAMGYLNMLVEPSAAVVEKIEGYLARFISLIPADIKYILEEHAREIRANRSSSSQLPTSEESTPQEFTGSGQRLGSE